jgi:kynureninase
LLIRLADEAGFEVTSRREQARRGASVTVRTPGFEGVHKELAERQIICDFRPDVGLRLGPHFFNTEAELEYAVGQIGEIVSSGAHERHLGAAARF